MQRKESLSAFWAVDFGRLNRRSENADDLSVGGVLRFPMQRSLSEKGRHTDRSSGVSAVAALPRMKTATSRKRLAAVFAVAIRRGNAPPPPYRLRKRLFRFHDFQSVAGAAGYGALPCFVVAGEVGRGRDVAAVAVVEEAAVLFFLDVAVHVFDQQVAVQFRPAVEQVLGRVDRIVGQKLDGLLRIVFVERQGRRVDGGDFGRVLVFHFVDYLDDVGADAVVAQVGEIGHAVEKPEGRRRRIFGHVSVALAQAFRHAGGRRVDRREARGARIVHAEPQDASDGVGQPAAGLSQEPEAGLLRGDRPFVDVFLRLRCRAACPSACLRSGRASAT